MPRKIILLFAFIVLPSTPADHYKYSQQQINPGDLPTVVVKISNQTSAKLALIISSTFCAQRIFLAPKSEIIIDKCFRRGIYYHIVAVFYDDKRILERLPDQLFLAYPGAEWNFFDLEEVR